MMYRWGFRIRSTTFIMNLPSETTTLNRTSIKGNPHSRLFRDQDNVSAEMLYSLSVCYEDCGEKP